MTLLLLLLLLMVMMMMMMAVAVTVAGVQFKYSVRRRRVEITSDVGTVLCVVAAQLECRVFQFVDTDAFDVQVQTHIVRLAPTNTSELYTYL